MPERAAFLPSIADNPADDTVRLAFADWLDEHREPERAEFIRLQIQIANKEPKDPRLKKLLSREEELLDVHRAEWLGPLKKVEDSRAFEVKFRRGFAESAMIHGRILAEYAKAIREHCPVLTELDVLGVRDHGRVLADTDLQALRLLRLEDWPYPHDIQALTSSTHLSRLETLSVWIGSAHDELICQALGSSKIMSALRKLELVQLEGGLDAFERAAEFDQRADHLAGCINAARGSTLASVYRPFAELFPLAPHVGRYLHGGTVPDGRQALVQGLQLPTACIVFYFDSDGHLLSGEQIDLSGSLHRKPRYGNYDEEELFARLEERIGFRPGMIRVHEFDAGEVIPDCWTRIYKFEGNVSEFLGNPDRELPLHSESREKELESVRYWLRSSNFCITHGGDDAWADESGQIHST